ncbi:MAG TPA: HAMP domain-containing histidine kinase [Candidatus Aphodocola excrementigallinarum]|uniref:histidine kinase n=1 Tax=Candidatus Aphodocola excrementigallinarum TaxID=2840670 RepID=A0A9D1LGT5_9FIRM|nr:HAMP domain-containing histidine kinase [Candidatus Aphodocola excrementigallinarum]
MKRWSSKTVTLLIVIILLAVNSGFLFSYYNFYLSDKITSDMVSAKDKNHESISIITKSIEGKSFDDALDLIKLYIDNNGGYIILKDINGKTIYTNNKDISKLFSSTATINIAGSDYELTYSNVLVTPGNNLVRNFVLYEIIIVSCVIIMLFFISSKQLINPIDTITKDINAYKFGKRPFKRKMPKNMQQIQNAFVDMVDSLELEKENQNQIIASISHDIKTPLTSVIGYADRLKNSNLSEDKKQKYVDKIYNKALTMKAVLEEFDDYQSCNIKETLKLEKVTIKSILEYVKKDFEDDLLDKKIKLSIKTNCNEKSVNVDLVKLKRVFSNVITNSVTHFKGNEGVINVNITSQANLIRFEIADNGGGIADEKDLKRIFEPLYTSDPSRKISGLGLSICKQIISSLDGRIYAKNNSIGGLSIVFVLPKA